MEYDIKWGNHQKWTVDCIKDLFGDEKFTDVTLISDDLQPFKAHRLILSSGSNFFKKIFTQISSPTNVMNNNLLYLKGIKGKTLHTLLKFIYKGSVAVPQEDLSKFLEAGFDLQVEGIISGNRSNMKDKTKESEIGTKETYPTKVINEVKKISKEAVNLQHGATKIEENDLVNLEEEYVGIDEEDESTLPAGLQIVEDNNYAEDEKLVMKYEAAEPDAEVKDKKLFYCDFDNSNSCKQSFASKRIMMKHKRTAHPKVREKTFTCEACPKKFYSNSEARTHFERKHIGLERKFSCNICEKKFFQAGDLRAHVNGVHLKIKEFGCHLCDRAFTQKCNLKTHLKKMHAE